MDIGSDKMNIGETTFLSSKYIDYVGVGRYEEALIPELEKLNINVSLIYINKREIGITPTINRMYLLAKQYILTLPKIFDIIHASSQFSVTKHCDVVTVHDLIGLKYSNMNILKRSLWKACLPLVKRAKHLIAVSESTKYDLVNITKIPEDKITVIYNGIDTSKFYPEKDKEQFEKPTLLFVGEFRQYKNVELLIQSMLRLHDFKLILVGKASETSQTFWNKWESFIIHKNLDIVWLKNIDDDKLRKLYSSADLFVFPSIYEGFGLPSLEAMACGTNVVALDTKINREILGGMAFFSKNNALDFSDTILKAMNTKHPSSELINYVKKKYSWKENAKQVKEIYEKVMN